MFRLPGTGRDAAQAAAFSPPNPSLLRRAATGGRGSNAPRQDENEECGDSHSVARMVFFRRFRFIFQSNLHEWVDCDAEPLYILMFGVPVVFRGFGPAGACCSILRPLP